MTLSSNISPLGVTLGPTFTIPNSPNPTPDSILLKTPTPHGTNRDGSADSLFFFGALPLHFWGRHPLVQNRVRLGMTTAAVTPRQLPALAVIEQRAL